MSLAEVYRPRDNRSPAFVAAVVLHVGVFLAVMYLGKNTPMLPVGASVPINIVSSAPVTDTKPAEEAPVAQTAATETPVPEVKPAPPPAPPKPAPSPVKAAPVPTPTPKKVTPLPTKPTTRPQPVAATPSFDLDALQASIAKAARSAPPRPSAAPRGQTRAETDLHARPDAGQGVSQSDILGLAQLLNRLWFKNCEGAEPVDVSIRLTIDADGRVSRADAGNKENSGNSAVAASAIRAISAVHKAEPYAVQFRNQTFPVNFVASKACTNR